MSDLEELEVFTGKDFPFLFKSLSDPLSSWCVREREWRLKWLLKAQSSSPE